MYIETVGLLCLHILLHTVELATYYILIKAHVLIYEKICSALNISTVTHSDDAKFQIF